MHLSASSPAVGWALITSGTVFILSFIFLALMFSTRKAPWGPLNDISYVIALLLILPFIIGFTIDHQPANFAPAITACALGVCGIAIIAITQLRLVFGKIDFELNLRQGAFGSGLLGTGFILLHLISINGGLFPSGLTINGLISGGLMAMGIPTGLFYGKEELAMTSGTLDWKATSKMAIAAIFSTFAGQIGLIILVFRMGIRIING